MTSNNNAASATEQKLLDIWRVVLDNSTIQIDDEFIDLGGDSLSAMMCISRVRNMCNYQISFEDFFMDGATIANFAKGIDDSNTKGKQAS
jgi:acyl carrier protein